MASFVLLPLLALAHVLPTQPVWFLPLFSFYWLILLSCRRYRQWLSCHPHHLSADSGSWLLSVPEFDAPDRNLPEFNAPETDGRVSALLTGEVLVWPWLLVLPFRFTHTGETYVLICLTDTASQEDLRRLRVQLRTG